MAGLSSLVQLKLFLLALISLTVLLVTVNGVYTGPRYGKRESSEIANRVLQKSSGGRFIQSRSGTGQRFYPGTRFGGKRAYWQPTQFASDIAENSEVPSSNLPYECFYTPFHGVRCSRPLEDSYGNTNDEQEQPNSAAPLMTINEIGAEP